MRHHSFQVAVIVCLLTVAPVIAWADPISVGGVQIEIPEPPGFVQVTPEMKSLTDWMERRMSSRNEQFAAFISEEDTDRARTSSIYEPVRAMTVEVPKTLIDPQTSLAQFQKIVRSTIEEEFSTKGQIARASMLEDTNRDHVERGIPHRVTSFKTLPPHDESDQSYSHSVNYEITCDDLGVPDSYTIPVTVTAVCVQNKLLMLYVSGDEEELEKTRESSKQWARAVIEANRSDAHTIARKLQLAKSPEPKGVELFRTQLLCVLIVGLIAIAFKLPGWFETLVEEDPPPVSSAEEDPKEEKHAGKSDAPSTDITK